MEQMIPYTNNLIIERVVQMNNIKKRTLNLNIILGSIILLTLIIGGIFLTEKQVDAKEKIVYTVGDYCYIITNEEAKEAMLIGVTLTSEHSELEIPGSTVINNSLYTITSIDFGWEYYEDEQYSKFYKKVTKLKVANDFTGTMENPLYAFRNLEIIEFLGTQTPEKIIMEPSNGSKILDVLFVVPEGKETEYAKIISETMYYYNGSDLYEKEINMTPTIVSEITDDIEYGIFQKNGFIYQIISSGKNKIGKVQLIGLISKQKHSYLALPETITNNGYTYKLTKLSKFALVRSGAKVIVIPDSVTAMESSVFDSVVELLFLSKNCKVIPARMITDENNESNLRFVSVPEGVQTISANAFDNHMTNTGSIILPTTIKSIGKKSLYSFKLVTFLNKKPIANISSAIKNGTTVKVNSSSIKTYKSVLSSKVTITAAKNIIKSKNLTLNKSSLKLSTLNTYQLKGTLTKGSNETIYWLSSDTNIFQISSKGVVTPVNTGTAYAIAYTRTSGLYKAIKVTVNKCE